MYISTKSWRDLEDNHVYHDGEKYPHDGREISAERIAALTSAQNKAGYALIKAVGEEVKKEPTTKPETAKTAKKPRKKTT